MKSLSASVLLLSAAVALAGCSSSPPASHTSSSSSTSTTQGVTAQSPTSSAPSGTGTVASSTTSTTNPPETAPPGAPITVSSPANGATVTSPLTVTGTSRLGGQSVQLVLTDGSGNVLSSASAHPGSNGAFTATMRFAATPGPGSLAAFVSGSGGAREDLIQVPVRLSD